MRPIWWRTEDVIILDSGSTTHEIATRLKASNVTVITNDLRIALTLAEQGNTNVIVAGGTLMASVYTLVGNETIDFLKNIKVHKLFLAATPLILTGASRIVPLTKVM